MEKKLTFLSTLALLIVVGTFKERQARRIEYALCKRQANERLGQALMDDSISKDEWRRMLWEETSFLKHVTDK